MTTSHDSSPKPLDETIFRPVDSDEVIDWLVRYDEALGSGATDHIPLGTTIEALSPESQGTVQGLRQCLDLLGVLRNSVRVADDTSRSGFQQAVDHWLLTGRRGPIDLTSKDLFVGRYRLLKEIGRGGYGVVFLADDPLLGRNVAVKLPLPEVLLSDGAKERFTSEGWAAASLDHPNVLRVFDAGEDGPICYIVSEYCAGPTLQKWIAKHEGDVSPQVAAAIVARLAEAVEHAHSRGILHRDLKPGNVLLQYLDDEEEPGNLRSTQRPSTVAPKDAARFPFAVKLADFGIAKCFDEVSGKTATGMILGTGTYMAPEQASGRSKHVCRSTDVYGLGAILYELLAGRQLFESESYADTLRKVVAEEPVLIHQIRRDVPRDLEAVCLKCLEKEPGNRYASAGELAADLRRFLAGETVKVRPAGVFRRLGKIYHRQSQAMKTLLPILVIGWGIALAMLMLYARTPRPPEITNNASTFDYFDDMRKAAELWTNNAERLQNNPRVAEEMEKILVRYIPAAGEPGQRGFEWHYLWRLAHPERYVEPLELVYSIAAHQGDAYFVVFSPDGTKLATAGADGTAKIFDVKTGEKLLTLTGHVGGVNWVEFASDGRPFAVTAGEDGTVRLWDTATGKEIGQFGERSAEVVAAAFSPTQPILATGDAHGLLTLWDLDTRMPLRSVQAYQERISAVAWSPDGTRIVTSSSVQKIWDAATLTLFAEHASPNANSAVFSPDGEMLAITGGMNAIYLEDVRTGSRRAAWEGFKDAQFQSVRFTSDGRSIISVGNDKDLILVCDVATRHCWNASPETLGPLWCIAPSPDSVQFATSGRDGQVRIWKQNIGPQWTIMTTPGNNPLQLSFPTAGPLAAGVFSDHPHDHDVAEKTPEPSKEDSVRTVFRAWDFSGPMPRTSTDFVDQRSGSFAYSQDSETIAVGGKEQITLLDAADGKVRNRVPFPSVGRFRRLVWLADGKSLAGLSAVEGSDSPTELSLNVLHLDTGKSMQLVRGPREILGRTGFSKDGRFIAILLSDRVDVFDTDMQSVIASMPFDGASIHALEFSPDRSLLAVGTSVGEVHFWHIASKSDLVVWNTNTQAPINSVSFLGDGNLVAAHSVRGRFVRLWSLDRHENVFSLPLPVSMSAGAKFATEVTHPLWQREPYRFAASADGNILAIAESATDQLRQRRTIYFWDGRTESPSQSVPRVRPALVSSSGQGKWAP